MTDDHMLLAEAFIETCYQMYHQFRTGPTPRNGDFNINLKASHKEVEIWPEDDISLLGLETVETLLCNYWFSGDKKFQDRFWKILLCFSKYASIHLGGCSSIGNVQNLIARDKMKSYFLGETLEYIYFLFLMTWIPSTLINMC